MKLFSGTRIPLGEGQFIEADAALFYDKHARRFMGQIYRRFAAGAAGLALPGNRVLDIGTGTGLLAAVLAKSHPEWQITGIDVSESMLAVARETALKNELSDRIKFRQASAESLPFADGSFEMVVSNTSLHCWNEPVKVFNELARVTAPGGYCLVWDNRRANSLNPFLHILGGIMRMNKAQRRLWVNACRSAYTVGEVKKFLKGSALNGAQVKKLSGLLMLGIEWWKGENPKLETTSKI
jgi:ubiquinone/menaquinone biosynthesis C-methylase UbiE